MVGWAWLLAGGASADLYIFRRPGRGGLKGGGKGLGRTFYAPDFFSP